MRFKGSILVLYNVGFTTDASISHEKCLEISCNRKLYDDAIIETLVNNNHGEHYLYI